LNWNVVENGTVDDPADGTASEKREKSSDIKGLFDRNQRTSVTPLPVGDNISLPPMPEKDARVNLIKGENDSLSEGKTGESYSPPPVAAFGGKGDASPHEKEPGEGSTGESAKGLFSMDAASSSKEKTDSQADSKAARSVGVPKGSRGKKTVMGIGLGQRPLPPIPSAIKDADRAKEAAIPRTLKSVKEESSLPSKPEGTKPDVKEAPAVEAEPSFPSKPEGTKLDAKEALADTLFSGISTIPSVLSKSTALPESKGESVEDQPTESPSPEPAKPSSVDAASFIGMPPKGKTIKTVALWSGAGLLLVVGLAAAISIGLNRSASKRSRITVVQERVERSEKEPIAASSQEKSINKVTAKPEINKPESDRVQPKQTEQPIEPLEKEAIQNQKAEPIEPPKEANTSENLQANTEKEPEGAIDIREMLERGKRQLRRGELDQAEASFRAILNHEPEEHHAMEGLVKILIERKQGGEALPYCELMIKKRSRRARYRILYGDALAMVGNKKAAMQQYNEALRYSPDNKEAKRRLAQSQ